MLLTVAESWKCFIVDCVCYSQETQTEVGRSGRHRQMRSDTLNIPKLSISVEDSGPKGIAFGSVLVPHLIIVNCIGRYTRSMPKISFHLMFHDNMPLPQSVASQIHNNDANKW